MLKKLKYYLWKHGLWKNDCPYCKNKLTEHGHEGHSDWRWTCQKEDCRFNHA